ncbi:hypothetical protein CA13_38250 [Planctomycetes bacterium CA13]|uniref:Right handed beta helix domain-containing protein n=1 Tax=Novipirellula herctigrandis TaxID=2527986 RepID=A0A5C5Z748_9BACT|nr:hypothetical protein CA13_38250 [Planctomycetes bacterium CA13]
MKRFVAALSSLLLLAQVLNAAEFHVSPNGLATSAGTPEQPFRTIQQAARAVRPGDTVLIHAGVYRESIQLKQSGTATKPIRFAAAPNEKVVISGADLTNSNWSPHANNVYKSSVQGPVRQLFVEGDLMIEARWPNLFMDRLWNRDRWSAAGKGSRYGKMVDPELAKTQIDWTGAVATLNVAHQFFTWTRTIKHHDANSETFEYDKDLGSITHYADKTRPWEDDRYYLTGKLEALDSPGEWFHDQDAKLLYLWVPDGQDPDQYSVEIKTRAYAFQGHNINHVTLQGIFLEACTFGFNKCHDLEIDQCHVRFPNVMRRIDDPEMDEFDKAETKIVGDDNRVTRCSFAWGPGSALRMVGRRNLVEDCLMHDFCWDGSLRTPMLSIASNGKEAAEDRCLVRHCTLFNCGNAILNYRGLPGHIVEYNHIYDGGLCCKDVALVYTGQPSCAGSVVRYNWVHGCFTEHQFKTESGVVPGGLGIRGDDQTRSLTVHHNVVWNCGRDGIIVKGDHNRVYNNTVFEIGTPTSPGNYISLHSMAEPEKFWREQHPLLLQQNRNSRIANNIALTISGDPKGHPYPFAENLSTNFMGKQPLLEDRNTLKFWPKSGASVIDGGTILPGFTEGFQGKAPDIGAYEYGGERWVPGIRWDPEQVLGYRPKSFVGD